MTTETRSIRISTPGRICLFGEHQDYLQLPVIACAISLRIRIEAQPRHDMLIRLALPDIGTSVDLSLQEKPGFVHERDYFRSGLKVLREAGFAFDSGFDGTITSTIPVNAGTSSSSALVVSWINLLSRISTQHQVLDPVRIAGYAHQAEVVEFHEPGGSMDHLTTALGHIQYIAFSPVVSFERLRPPLGTFVLGNSGHPKNTTAILSQTKNRTISIMKKLQAKNPDLSYHSMTLADAETAMKTLTLEENHLLTGTLRNRDITQDALALMRSEPFDMTRFGELLTEHHQILRDNLGVSTPKIDRMLDAALEAGAHGGKINGSGGGGCMFVYAPSEPEKIAEAITKEGGKTYIVSVDEGTRRDT